jgi:cation diffusion facilitator CzcD-associated flavoprotein CzcO
VPGDQPKEISVTHDDLTHVHVAIIGSGFSGLGVAIRMKQEGINDFVILERAKEVGGTWRDNTYPGCACDVPSHLYSFSFAPNPDWSRAFSPQPEIFSYLKHCASHYGITPHIRFEHVVASADWDETAQRWRIATSKGTITADVMIGAAGALSDPAVPTVKGIERFEGPAFHSAKWDHGAELAGRSVAVVGTGASAIQFVPEIQPKVAQLSVFQRTPPWILPRRNREIPARAHAVFRALPAAQQFARSQIYAVTEVLGLGFRHPKLMEPLEKLARSYLEKCVVDPVLRAKLTPNYKLGCKRILFSSRYLPTLAKPNVEVVTDAIQEVRARSIVTKDGRERAVDAIIFGTGFHVTDLPFGKLVRGRSGRTLDDLWKGSPQAHLGTSVSGFPNFFLLLGPNTGLGHTSVVYMIESQIAHIVSALRYMKDHGLAAVEPRAEAQAAFIADLDRRMASTVWSTGGCSSWYMDKTGRNSTLWPDATWRFRRRVQTFNASEYLLGKPIPRAKLAPSPGAGVAERAAPRLVPEAGARVEVQS